jgi:hypothetical protein
LKNPESVGSRFLNRSLTTTKKGETMATAKIQVRAFEIEYEGPAMSEDDIWDNDSVSDLLAIRAMDMAEIVTAVYDDPDEIDDESEPDDDPPQPV